MPTAYSYIRFSNLTQENGDSLRRQTSLRNSFVERKKLKLDTNFMIDKGVSALHGRNLHEGPLAEFIKAVHAGKIKPGSYLILEKIDRFSRTDVDVALSMFTGLVKAGITIVTLEPEREWGLKDIRGFGLLELVVHLLLANEESIKKSDRLGHAWHGKRLQIAEKKLTKMAPAWLEMSDDRRSFKPVAEKVAIVRRIYRETLAGVGVGALQKKFNREGVPVLSSRKSRTAGWHRSYLLKILHSRAVLGEFQPGKKANKVRTTVGQPVADYFPAIISETDYYKVQDILSKRARVRGPVGETVSNLFSNLIFDARDRASMTLVNKGDGRALVSSAAQRGVKGSRYVSFPYALFERTFLRLTKELRPSDLQRSSKGDDAADQIEGLTAKVGTLTKKIEALKARFALEDDVDELADILKKLVTVRNDTLKRIETLKGSASSTKRESLTETQSLVEAIDNAKGEELLKLRTALKARIRQLVESIWVYFDNRCEGRIALAQVFFVGGGSRLLAMFAHRLHTVTGGVKTKIELPAEYDLRDFASLGKNKIIFPEVAAVAEPLEYVGEKNGKFIFKDSKVEVEFFGTLTLADHIRPALLKNPTASPKEIAARLHAKGVEVTPGQVAQVAYKIRQKAK